ncbi:MAG TPA: hypothetical protein VH877_09985 [Polyangia bacterium]|jgi:hypothetical protein|nr:hypothetical protein [Polyangia bacterium]
MSVLLGACATGTDNAPGALDVQSSTSGLKGTYTLGKSKLKFSSTEVGRGVYDVVVDINGATLSALVDQTRRVAEVDGFAGNGADTQLVDADRELLNKFVGAINEQVGSDRADAASTLSRVASNWSQTPETVPLQRQVAGEENRDWTSICAYYYYYVDATHDDNNYNDFSPYSTSHAHVGYRSASTYYYVNGSWITTTQNHVPLLYEYGNCYGNCGAGCPSGAQTLTLDCHDHDQCVRNGHAIASLYCDDEFTSASDDEFFAPTCSGT